jgi:cytochrome b561
VSRAIDGREASGRGARYGVVAQVLHWLTAALVFTMFGLGWYMSDLPLTDPQKFTLYQWHKSLGITILALVILRLAWRLGHKAPPWPPTMQPWERLAATAAHWALYGLLMLQPLIGILQSNAANFPIVLFGQIQLPALLGTNEALGEQLLAAHHFLASVLATLILIHIAAALRHHFLLKDDILTRMRPGGSRH